MKIRIISDLHLEFGEVEIPAAPADLTILAGDIHTKGHAIAWISENFPDREVLYIAGNHEFYGSRFPRQIGKLKELAVGTKIHVLENEVLELGGCRFFGGSLWTDMNLTGDVMVGSVEASALMNDYRRIRHSETYRKLRPVDTRARHLQTLAAIGNFLDSGDPRRSIVVTHHAPSALSLPERRRTQILSCAYASHLDDFIVHQRPLLWIHGHIHHSQDYLLGETRILANPRGYPDKPNPAFNPLLTFELP
ncbi:metallophosphoesterase [Haloferula sp. BvORR071]|uniref:metallophosphoesterase n=1 Tax=Haloferula sp. BvORR071 TaxID=1396141 RepID=UPI00054F19FE|nr:metallophosphoesterase [Haloferula sp. BvORR071]